MMGRAWNHDLRRLSPISCFHWSLDHTEWKRHSKRKNGVWFSCSYWQYVWSLVSLQSPNSVRAHAIAGCLSVTNTVPLRGSLSREQMAQVALETQWVPRGQKRSPTTFTNTGPCKTQKLSQVCPGCVHRDRA